MNENKLLEFQKRVSAIPKDSTNPFFKSTYFDINTVIDIIKPILNEVGLVVSQPIGIHDGKNVLMTNVLDGDKKVLESVIVLPEIPDVQKFGAAITYYRRYALVSLLFLQGEEDDDGNKIAPVKSKSAITAEKKSTGTKATFKQINFVKSLLKQKGKIDLVTEDQINSLTMSEAKKWIDKLTAMPDVQGFEVGRLNSPKKDDEIIREDLPEWDAY